MRGPWPANRPDPLNTMPPLRSTALLRVKAALITSGPASEGALGRYAPGRSRADPLLLGPPLQPHRLNVPLEPEVPHMRWIASSSAGAQAAPPPAGAGSPERIVDQHKARAPGHRLRRGRKHPLHLAEQRRRIDITFGRNDAVAAPSSSRASSSRPACSPSAPTATRCPAARPGASAPASPAARRRTARRSLSVSPRRAAPGARPAPGQASTHSTVETGGPDRLLHHVLQVHRRQPPAVPQLGRRLASAAAAGGASTAPAPSTRVSASST